MAGVCESCRQNCLGVLPAVTNSLPAPSHLHPHTCTLTPAPSHLHPRTCTLTPAPSHLHPHTCTPTPAPSHLHPHTCTPTPAPSHLHPHTCTLTPAPSHLHPHTCTLTPAHSHLHPHTCTYSLGQRSHRSTHHTPAPLDRIRHWQPQRTQPLHRNMPAGNTRRASLKKHQGINTLNGQACSQAPNLLALEADIVGIAVHCVFGWLLVKLGG